MPKKVVINEGVSNISNYAFYNCTSLGDITIPNTVTSIDFDALAKTNIKKLTIPNSVTTIADCAFWGNPLVIFQPKNCIQRRKDNIHSNINGHAQ